MRTRLRETARAGVRRVGWEPRLRRLRRALDSANADRNRRDDAALIVLMSAILDRDSRCVDVGAHRGTILQHMVRLAPEGRHIAYEPLPELAAALHDRFPGVDVHAAATGAEPAAATFQRMTEDPATSALEWAPPTAATRHVYPPASDQAGISELTVPVERLDDALASGPGPAFIKVDVEGAEAAVFAGGMRTLVEHRPHVAFEHGLGCLRYDEPPGGVYGPLCDEAGLRLFDMDGGGPYSRRAFEETVASGERWFFFARP